MPVEHAEQADPGVALTFGEDGVVNATGREATNQLSEGENAVGDQGRVTMTFERGEMHAVLSDCGDTLEVEFRGRTGKMVRLER